MKRSDEMAGFESDDFEIDLSLAMRPVDAPEGFSDRVLERMHAPAMLSKPSTETMDEFELELALAMRHVDAAEGFADRVMRLVATREVHRAKVLTMPHRVRFWAAGAIAAALLVAAFGAREQRERREREEAAAQARQQFQLAVQITGKTLAEAHAQQQLELAMQITGDTLASVRAQLQQSGIQLGD